MSSSMQDFEYIVDLLHESYSSQSARKITIQQLFYHRCDQQLDGWLTFIIFMDFDYCVQHSVAVHEKAAFSGA